MTDFKKGGPLQNSNIYATNRLFVKNPLFKKRKKKRAPGVYNPKAKFKYEDGGSIMDLTEEEIQKYIDGGYVVEEVNDPSIPALNRFDNGGDTKPGVQNLPETTIYDPKSKKIQLNLLQQLDTAKKAYQNYTKQNKGKKWKLNIADASSSIEDIKKGIQLYKDEFKKEKEETERELKRLESLKNKSAFKDNKDIQNLTLKDLSTVKGKAKLLDAARSSNLSGDEVAALYKGWGLDQADYNVKKGSGPNAVYSAKEARQNWGDPEEWKKFNKLVGNAAMGIAGIGAAGAMGSAGAALLENPVVQGGLTAYGLYDATTNTIPEAYKDFSEGRYLEGAGNVALAGLDLVPGVGLAGKGAKLAGKGLGKIGTKLDKAIYPTRAYRSEALTGNTGFGEQSELAKKVFEKGDWATKSPKEAFHYLKGSEYVDESTGLLGGQDMKFTEYKIPFWKKDVSFDPDVAELKKLQGEKINTNEFIVPNKTALDRFLYPSRSTTIKAVPENVKAELTPTQFAPEGVPLYYPGSMPAGTTSDLYASPAYKYIEDQLNAVTGHELPITHQYGSGNYPIKNYVEPQFAPNEGLGKFTRFSNKDNTAFYKSKNTGTNTSTGLTEVDIAAARAEEEAWLTSDEYLKRRMKNTGESAKAVREDVAKILKRADKANYNVNADLKGAHGEMATNIFINPKVSVSKTAPNPNKVLRHENIHLYSPASAKKTLFSKDLHKNWDKPNVAELKASERGVYANYPTIGDSPESIMYADPSDYHYNMLGYEQQARHLGAMRDIAAKNNVDIKAGKKLTEQQVRSHIDDFIKNRENVDYDYDEIWGAEILNERKKLADAYGAPLDEIKKIDPDKYKEIINVSKDNAAKRITKVLNNAWVVAPTVGVAGTATMLANPFQGSNGLQQQKKGGATDDYIELDIPEEEIQWYIDQGYRVEPVTKLKKFIG